MSSVGWWDGQRSVTVSGSVQVFSVDCRASEKVNADSFAFLATSTSSQLNEAERDHDHEYRRQYNAKYDVEHATAGVYVPCDATSDNNARLNTR